MTNPKVSIITVVYNGVQYIEQTIKSVMIQDYKNIEYIVIDGGSTDGTQEIITKYESDIAHWISEKDTGIYNAMNKGLQIAKGDIIAILNADDYYYPNTINDVVTHFLKTNAAIVYGNLTKFRTISSKEYFVDITPDINTMQSRMGIFHPATFIKKEVYQELGHFNEKYKLSADYDFILRAYNKKYDFQYLNKSLTYFRIGGASNTNCNSYKEGVMVLSENNSPFVSQMKRAYFRCQYKQMIKRVINTLVKIFGLQEILNKRIEKKWS
jgi:glycosyltransferase involved in cell wall biosynthesis